jgi:hypothetical protein
MVDIGFLAIAALMVSIIGGAYLFHARGRRTEREIVEEGIQIEALVEDVRNDEGDCLVTYTYTDTESGRKISRTGVFGFIVAGPMVGEKVVIRVHPRNRSESRLESEVDLAA